MNYKSFELMTRSEEFKAYLAASQNDVVVYISKRTREFILVRNAKKMGMVEVNGGATSALQNFEELLSGCVLIDFIDPTDGATRSKIRLIEDLILIHEKEGDLPAEA